MEEVDYISFGEWCEKFAGEQTRFGDFARENKEDSAFTGDFYVKILAHLYDSNASEECIETFREMWEIYMQEVLTRDEDDD